jgi:hypothetical protein
MKVEETEREIEGWKDRNRQTEEQKDSKTMKRERETDRQKDRKTESKRDRGPERWKD